MVNERLVWYLEKNGLLAKQQCGYRSNRSTVDHLVRLVGSQALGDDPGGVSGAGDDPGGSQALGVDPGGGGGGGSQALGDDPGGSQIMLGGLEFIDKVERCMAGAAIW